LAPDYAATSPITSSTFSGSKVTVKTMMDHGGHPKRNNMVIYDDDPRIEAVMKAALDRHQDTLKEQEDFLARTHHRQQQLDSEKFRTSELKKKELQHHVEAMRLTLEQQMDFKHSLK
jgi:hypothetical protein